MAVANFQTVLKPSNGILTYLAVNKTRTQYEWINMEFLALEPSIKNSRWISHHH